MLQRALAGLALGDVLVDRDDPLERIVAVERCRGAPRPEGRAVLAHELLFLDVHRVAAAQCVVRLAPDAVMLLVAGLNDTRRLPGQLARFVSEHPLEGRTREHEAALPESRNVVR